MRPPLLLSCALAWLSAPAFGAPPEPLRFNRDIRPILSENCFHCHGQDAAQRKAGLRLDTVEGALAEKDGVIALVPGQPEESELYLRMISTDEDEVMPPRDSHRTVTPEQIALVKRWIEEGGAYEAHWAFTPPPRPPLPEVAHRDWARVPWDDWVMHDLETKGLVPAPDAAPETWLRRASFDMTGLPPTPAETDAFLRAVARDGEAAYAAVADRLLASPRYGERLTADWMDVARYADTHGFNNDSARSMWRWRDWVIEAFNNDLPYDQFLTKQLAGDLLPEPSLDDLIATGFGRNHVINSEGGIIDEEYRVEYVADRVRTLGQAWLGLTLECARCHDHKYDPVTAKDYYQLFAFFNQVPEWGEDGRVANAAPLLPTPTRDQQAALAALDRRLTVARAELVAAADGISFPTEAAALEKWLTDTAATLTPPSPKMPLLDEKAVSIGLRFPGTENMTLEPAQFGSLIAVSGGKSWTLAVTLRWDGGDGALLSSMNYRTPESSTNHADGIEVRITAEGKLELRASAKWPVYALQVRSVEKLTPRRWHEVAVVSRGEGRAAGYSLVLDGRECEVEVLHDGLTGGPGAKPLTVGNTSEKTPAAFHGSIAGLAVDDKAWDADELAAAADAAFLQRTLNLWRENWEPAAEDHPRLTTLARDLHPTTKDLARQVRALHAERLALQRQFPTTMVMVERTEPRPTYVLNRGAYDAPGEAVTAGVPESLLGAWPEGAPRNRLGLARWLTKPDHPLTARVVVNRFWQEFFGTGLVKTSEDFGFQGEYPPHPELLDTLAREFIDGGWSVKQLLRSFVLSSTYRQTSATIPERHAADPENRQLARGPRVRLPAEMIRDQALFAAGLLHERLGGPSVFPDQPEDLYKGVVVDAPYPGTKWTTSEGADRHRRSLYTFWKRTVPHPVLTVFDTPDREFGCTRRTRTNTPLQALALMNEPALLRAAGHLGQRLQREGGATDDARLQLGFRWVTGRAPTPVETDALTRLLKEWRASFRDDPTGAKALRHSSGLADDKISANDDLAESATWIAFASTLLNLDEVITKN